MFGMILVAQAPRRRRWWQRKPKPTLRQIAVAVSNLQRAEGRAIHAMRDHCLPHGLEAAMARRAFIPLVPGRLLRSADWRHEHIEAPGARIQARVEDSWRESER
jgi:hypothetical protein